MLAKTMQSRFKRWASLNCLAEENDWSARSNNQPDQHHVSQEATRATQCMFDLRRSTPMTP
eukprot:13360528-Alexandrium_andersonii.AAC.1